MKRKLLFVALCVAFAIGGGNSLSAQTNVTSTYLTNAGFEGSQTKKVTTKGGEFNEPANWTLSTTPGTSTYHYATTSTDTKTEGSKSFKARFNWANFSYELSQTTSSSLPAGSYTVQVDVRAHTISNSDSPTKVYIKGNDAKTEIIYTSSKSNFETLSVNVDLYKAGPLTITLGFDHTHGGGNNGSRSNICYIDNVKIIWKHDIVLNGYIKKATALNSVLNNDDLAAAIEAAQEASDNSTPTTDLSEAISAISSAISTATSDMTQVSLSNGNFDTSIDMDASGTHSATAINTTNAAAYEVSGWTGNFGPEYVYGATSVYGTSSEVINGSKSPAADMYGETTGGVLHLSSRWDNSARYKQTVENLPSGRYIFYYETNNQNVGTESVKSNFFGVDGTSGDFYGTTNSFVYSSTKTFPYSVWTAQAFEFDVARTANVNFHVGVVGAKSGTDGAKLWVDNVLVYRIGDYIMDESTANALISSVEALDDIVFNATEKSDLATKLTAFQNSKNIDNYYALSDALSTANTSVTTYTALNAAITKMEGWTVTTAASDIRAKYNAGTYTDDVTADDIYAEYQEAEGAALAAAGATNYTSVILNPSFETGDLTGWTAESRTDMGVKETNNSTYSITSGDRTSGNYMFNMWGGSSENEVYQTIKNLPAGTYTLTAVLTGFKDEVLTIAAGEASQTVTVTDGKTVGYLTYVTFTLDATTDVVIKASNTRNSENPNSDYSFIKADNFQLYAGDEVPGSAYKPNLFAAINEVSVPTTNVGTAAFQYSDTKVGTVNTAKNAAQTVYDDANATKSEIDDAISTLKEAVDDMAILNAPADDQLFNIVNVSENYNHANNAVTFKAASDADLSGNTTTIGYNDTPGSIYPQGVKFTAVDGVTNGFILSYTRADGNTVYVGTGASTGLSNSEDQIRPTNDPTKAVTIQVVATSTAGVWNLYNTRANKNIGANGASDQGFYTVNTYNSMKLQEAANNQVSLNISSTIQYGTLILPFDAAIPTGVTAYSVAQTDGGWLQLDEVEGGEFKAHTPYILYAEEGSTAPLEGLGSAYTDASYTEGLLTGVYADIPAPVGSYVLLYKNNKVGFYPVVENKQPTVGANRAYLTDNSGQANVRAFFFNNDDLTGIDAIGALTSGQYDAIYTGNGVKVKSLQKGMNIVVKGGKTYKIFVK